MGFITGIFGTLYWLHFEKHPQFNAAVFAILFPFQAVLWCLSHDRKTKDFLFCLSLLISLLFLKHLLPLSDTLFYLSAIVISALVRYPVLLALTGTSLALEVLREWYFQTEKPEAIAFRYVLFLLAGTVSYFLLRQEKREKEEIRKELDDLRYGIHQVEDPTLALLTDEGKASRKVDAALALDKAMKNILGLAFNVFKPDVALFWQFLPDKEQLRVRNRMGTGHEVKENAVVALGEGPVGWAGLNRKPYFQQDRELSLSFGSKKTAIQSMLAVPVLAGERLEGVISLDSTHLNFFPADAPAVLESFAAQMSEMIRMARLAKEREETGLEFQAFYHASQVLSSMIDFEEIIRKFHSLSLEIVKSDFTAIAVMQDESHFKLYQWAYTTKDQEVQVLNDLPHEATTWISWFLQNREEPLILSGAQLKLQEMPILPQEERREPFAAYMAVPMRHQNKCVGAVLLASERGDAFTSHQSRILSILCNQAAVSLENATILKTMEQLAITDGLTGLFNHRYFQDAFDRELERASRQKQNLSLLLLDIDHFKGLNDTFGHPAGDFVLKNLSAILRGGARKIDILARYGGEEFAALLPGIDLKNARKTAERWRKAIQRATIKWEKKSFAITVSIGIASYPQDGEEKKLLIDKSDKALYYSKDQGRNQVRHFSEIKN
jgi:diguanylate cyclase (GGDEF)-like protein